MPTIRSDGSPKNLQDHKNLHLSTRVEDNPRNQAHPSHIFDFGVKTHNSKLLNVII